jgi:hypothetical protein
MIYEGLPKEATLHVDKTCEVPRYWWPIGTLISKWDKLHTWIDKHTFENEIELVNSQWPMLKQEDHPRLHY